MNRKFVFSVVVVCVALSLLIFSAVKNTAKAVVTVDQLIAEGVDRNNIRIGARVAESKIRFDKEPEMLVSFKVRDIAKAEKGFPVVYQGIMPDTLKVNRDVIMEGDFRDGTFHAISLLTQCPSKYEPPSPGK